MGRWCSEVMYWQVVFRGDVWAGGVHKVIYWHVVFSSR